MNITPKYLYNEFYKLYGPLNWWPVDKKYHKKNESDHRFEIIIGTILTQNTAWSNVEKAINNLKSSNLLTINAIIDTDISILKNKIKPSGYFNQKAERLKEISFFFEDNYKNNLDIFFKKDINIIRKELLSIKGVGPETADSILLYAGQKPIFVVDAYTKRICERLPLNVNISYSDIQDFFHRDLSKEYNNQKLILVYNELHAHIVEFAKNICKKKPVCNNCPFIKKCSFYIKSVE